MISQADLQRRLLIAAQSAGRAPVQGPPPALPLLPPPPPPSQYQGLLNLAGDAKVPEAIRTSATDAANKHAALAGKAGMDPHDYRSGGEAAEDQGKAERTPAEGRRQPKPPPTIFEELGRRARGPRMPPGQAPGPGFPIGVAPPLPQAPGPGFPLDTGGQAPGPGFPVGVPPPPLPVARSNKPGFGQVLSGGLDVMENALGLPPGGPQPAPQPLGADQPGPDLGIDGVAPLPMVGAVRHPSAPPGQDFPVGIDSPQKRRQEFDARRHAAGKAITDTLRWPFRGGTHYDEARQEQVADEPPPDQPESPNDTRLAAPSFPLTPPGERQAPGVPVSKPGNIPPRAGKARPKSKAEPGTGWKINDGAPGPLGLVKDERPGVAGGIEKTLGAPHQLFPMEKYTGPSPGNATAGGGGSTAPDPNAAPTYSREAEALKPIDPPKPMNPLAFALIKGGAALMASKSQFGQALGEGIGAGLEGYVEAQNVDFENLRKANEDARASRKEAREEYTDTQLKRWIAGKESGQADRGLDIRTLESDRAYNLGERGISERGREADLEHQVGMGNLGIAGMNAQTARGQLGVAQGGLEVARQGVTPPDAREVMAYTQQLMETYPELKANPQKAYEAAQAMFLKMHPAPAYGGGLDAILAGQQRPAIPESGIGAAVPR
jgi:hypothetical protein